MNGRGWTWTLFAFLLALFIGLHAYLGRYAHPMADDFSYALKDVSLGAWNAASWEYHHWNGRYTSNLLVLFGPLRGGFEAITLYRSIPGALLCLTFLGAWFLIATLGSPTLGRGHAALGALIWTALYAHVMPDMPEGFYWYTGSVTYQLPSALTLIAAAFLFRAFRDRRPWLLLPAAALNFIIIGCNEVIMALLVAATAIALAFALRQQPRPIFQFVLMAGVVLLGAAFVVLAPGNEGRSTFFPERHRLLPSLGMSVLQTGRFSLEWLTCPSLAMLSMIWWMHHRPLSERIPPLANGFGLKPRSSLALLFGTVFLCVFPAYWSTGILGQHRTANVACFFFLPLWFMNLSVLATRFGGTVLSIHATDRRRVTAALLLLVIFDFGFTGNSGDALQDLTSGRADRADQRLWERYDLLREAAERPDRIAIIPFIPDPPRSLYVLDLRDRRFLVNQDYAAWFGLKEVRPLIRVQMEEAKATN